MSFEKSAFTRLEVSWAMMRYDTFAVREKLDAFERRNAARIEIDRLDRSGSGNVDQSVGIEKRSDFGIPLLRVG